MTNSDHTRGGGDGRYGPHGYQQPPASRRNQPSRQGAMRPEQQGYHPQYGHPDQTHSPQGGGRPGEASSHQGGYGDYDPSLDQRPRPPASGRASQHHSQPPQQQDDYYYPQGQNVFQDVPSYAMPPAGRGGTHPHHSDTQQDWGEHLEYPPQYKDDQGYQQEYASYGEQGYEPDAGMQISQRLAQLQNQYDQERAAATWSPEAPESQGYYPDQQAGGHYDDHSGYYQNPPALPHYQEGPQSHGYETHGYDDQYQRGGNDDYYADNAGGADQSEQATPYYQGQYSHPAGHDYSSDPVSEKGGVLKRVLMGSSFVAALMVGGGVAYTYKYTDMFGGGNASGSAPIVKAESSPVKIVKTPDSSSNESLNNSMHKHMAGEETNDPIGERLADDNKEIGTKVAAAESGMLPSDSGAMAAPGAPRRVKTLIVRPDGTILQPAGSDDELNQGGGDAASDSGGKKEGASEKVADSSKVTEAPTETQQTASIQPEVTPVERPAAKLATIARPSTVGEIGIPYVVQVTSRSSQTSALAAFADMQQKYPSLIGSYEPDIQRADLGEKGIWYRLRVGPVATKTAANDLCDKLKAAGHPGCFVRKK